MKANNYFKRLDYTKEDIDSRPFSNMRVKVQNGEWQPVEDFLQTAPAEYSGKVFDFTKSEREKYCGLGKLYTEEVKTKRNAGVHIRIPKNSAASEVFIHFSFDDENSVLFDQSYIEIEEGAQAKIFFYLDSKTIPETAIFRNGLITVRAGKNSELEFIKVQNITPTGTNFETMKIDAGKKSAVRLYDIQLGGKTVGVSNSTYMKEEWADVQIYPLYFADNDRRMDLEQNFIINGQNSHGLIAARGALKNTAKKIFRGNIFLNKGCSHSIARFSDNTIMLNKTAVGTSIPTIFCDEDDVVGEHAASFEAIDGDKLYYLMTRGFDEFSAKKLIIEAAFKPVFAMIEDNDIRQTLVDEFDTHLEEMKA
ncbi:SufB/sufD domain protein [Treponema phagedenis F0421]|uniref:Fe-S cluster assembly protein SufD n=1 Tax=Treponema phagedenis TaxID=162 RepID=UPI0001F6372D|nr:Fe-S cluster assembly protein SufD [Treponema phagedenis]EFW36981.1 SufB/sufD domain protein [Treponema phagedenis F0421]